MSSADREASNQAGEPFGDYGPLVRPGIQVCVVASRAARSERVEIC